MSILCSISTRGRYDTTLPLAITSVINQTLRPTKLVIFDDNDEPQDLRQKELYKYLFNVLESKGIDWGVIYGEKKGQHYNHQKANYLGYDWVWRLDDDTIAEADVLEKLYAQTGPDVGAVGGSILTPPVSEGTMVSATGLIDRINEEPNSQWGYIDFTREVDHLHCSFLYRAGIVDYNLSLSKVAHREETFFTYDLKKAGYKILITPCVTWHLRNSEGGIRWGNNYHLFERDDKLFQYKDRTIVVLDCGMGDHIVFKHVLPEIEKPLVFTCYPDIVPGLGLADAQHLLGDSYGEYNIYSKMEKWNWTGSLEEAFREMYVRKRK